MIKPACDFCGKELQDFGALLFSPPKWRTVKKYHLCVKCFEHLIHARKIIHELKPL